MFEDNLRRLRRNRKMTQESLAKDIHVSAGTIAMWETKKRQPDIETLKKLAQYFNVSLDDLIGNTELPVVQPQPLTIEQAKDLWLNSLDPEDKTTITMFLDLDFKNKLKVQGYIMSLSGQVSV